VNKPLSKFRDESKQLPLADWANDKELKHYRAATTYVGDFFEEQTSQMFENSRRFRTLSGHVCPDLAVGRNLLECKAMRNPGGKSGHTLIYLHRIHAYEALLASMDYDLQYLFWVYRGVKSSDFKYKSEVIKALATTEKTLFVVNHKIVHRFVTQMKIEIDKRFDEGKDKFVRVNYNFLHKLADYGWLPNRMSDVEVYGHVSQGPTMVLING